jgi:hypothetical protein
LKLIERRNFASWRGQPIGALRRITDVHPSLRPAELRSLYEGEPV